MAWVRVPTLTSSANNTVYLYYGYASATDQQNAPASGTPTTSASGTWMRVQRMGSLGMTSRREPTDGTPLNFNGAVGSRTNGVGQIDGADELDGVDDRVDAGSDAVLDDLGPLTISAWVKPDTYGASNAPTVIRKDSGSGSGRWLFGIDNTAPESNSLEFLKGHTTTTLDVASATGVIVIGAWQQVVATWDGSVNVSGVHLYVNGLETAYGATQAGVGTPISDAIENVVFGAAGDGTSALHGSIDEVHISNTVRSADWIQTEYNNQNSPGVGGFLASIGSEETESGGSSCGAGQTVYSTATSTTYTVPAGCDTLQVKGMGRGWRRRNQRPGDCWWCRRRWWICRRHHHRDPLGRSRDRARWRRPRWHQSRCRRWGRRNGVTAAGGGTGGNEGDSKGGGAGGGGGYAAVKRGATFLIQAAGGGGGGGGGEQSGAAGGAGGAGGGASGIVGSNGAGAGGGPGTSSSGGSAGTGGTSGSADSGGNGANGGGSNGDGGGGGWRRSLWRRRRRQKQRPIWRRRRRRRIIPRNGDEHTRDRRGRDCSRKQRRRRLWRHRQSRRRCRRSERQPRTHCFDTERLRRARGSGLQGSDCGRGQSRHCRNRPGKRLYGRRHLRRAERHDAARLPHLRVLHRARRHDPGGGDQDRVAHHEGHRYGIPHPAADR